jgi:hypothetical protein
MHNSETGPPTTPTPLRNEKNNFSGENECKLQRETFQEPSKSIPLVSLS